MAGVNKAILIGNLGADPEKRVTPDGRARTSFRVATSERWKNKSGELQERTDWHNIITWGQQAEVCAQYLSKGRPVYIEGKIRNRSWEDNDGKKKYITEIQADKVQFLGSRNSTSTNQSSGTTDSAPGFDPNSDDVPF